MPVTTRGHVQLSLRAAPTGGVALRLTAASSAFLTSSAFLAATLSAFLTATRALLSSSASSAAAAALWR